jgi:hypothetical protein
MDSSTKNNRTLNLLLGTFIAGCLIIGTAQLAESRKRTAMEEIL